MTAAIKTKQKTCPVDGTIMRELRYENDVVDLCESCHGIWCDDEELRNIIHTIEKEFKDLELDASLPSRVKSENRTCPTCDSTLHENNFSYNSGIMLDRCPSGHGVWLDYVELEKIQIFSEKWEKSLDKNRAEYTKALTAARNEALRDFEKGQNYKAGKLNESMFGKLFKKIFG